MDINIKLDNPCDERKDFCINCHNHFMTIRPFLRGIVVSKHFIRDSKDKEKMNSIIKDILDCSHLEFNELHKFEEHINGNLIFRAKKEQLHIVYCINKKMRTVFFFKSDKTFFEI